MKATRVPNKNGAHLIEIDRDYNAWYHEKRNGKTTETWAERATQLGYKMGA